MAAQTQADLVEQFLARQNVNREVSEKLRIPRLESHFTGVPEGSVTKTENVRLPGLSLLGTKPRGEIADVLVNLASYKRGVVSIDWDITASTMTVGYVEGLEQRKFKTDAERNELIEILVNVLKARPQLTGLRWDFGASHIELRYLAY